MCFQYFITNTASYRVKKTRKHKKQGFLNQLRYIFLTKFIAYFSILFILFFYFKFKLPVLVWKSGLWEPESHFWNPTFCLQPDESVHVQERKLFCYKKNLIKKECMHLIISNISLFFYSDVTTDSPSCTVNMPYWAGRTSLSKTEWNRILIKPSKLYM